MIIIWAGIRIFLGLFLLANGFNFWFHFLPVSPPDSQAANDLMHGLVASGLFEMVKFVEIGAGVALLANRFVPLALLAMLPLTVVIAWVDFVLIREMRAIVFGCLLVVPQICLMLRYLSNYLPLFAMRASTDPVSIQDLCSTIFGKGAA